MFEPNQHDALTSRRDVSMLFADLRDSSRLAAALNSEQAFGLFGQVMDCLTAAVMEHGGLVIDYYGDGLAAMWNAPTDQPEHAEQACGAALRMLETLPDIAAAWTGLLDVDFRLGIGVHTGAVQVGNTGSRQHAKYGPRGPNVNLVSRVEAATKLLGLPLLTTSSTASQLSNRLLTYRTCRATLPGVHRPVDLFRVVQRPTEIAVMRAIGIYERSLKLFEDDKLQEAAAELAKLDAKKDDVPIAFLSEQIKSARGTRKRRRNTDRVTQQAAGVIALNVK